MNTFIVSLLGVVAVLGALEVGARVAGLIDFPVFEANNRIGYVPVPNQSGRFMAKNDWHINELSMGTDKIFSDSRNDILLVGDSIVWGGNAYRHEEKLAAQVQNHLSNANVWPISAGSWSVINQTNWLADHPQVVKAAETVIFVLNEGDFGKPSSWSNPLTHPTSKPLSALVYLAQKYVLKPNYALPEKDMVVPDESVSEALAREISICACKAVIWLHSTRSEMNQLAAETGIERNFAAVSDALPVGVEIYRVRDIPNWSAAFYQDDIHPTPAGLSVMADAIAAKLTER